MLGDVNKLFVFKSLLTTPSNVLLLHLKQTFPPIIWIFTEGEGGGIESRLPFKIFSTLLIWHFRRSFSRYSVFEWYKGLKEIPWDHRSIALSNATLWRFWDHCDILIRNEPRAGARDFAPRWNPKCAGKLARAFAKAHHKVFH